MIVRHPEDFLLPSRLFFSAVVLAGLMNISCGSNSENTEGLDYNNLEEIVIQKISEFGDEGEFWTGELKEAVIIDENTILVSDERKATIEQFNSEGKYVETIAIEGEGPGELSSYFMIISAGNDQLGVWHDAKRQLDFFERGPDGIFRYVRSEAADSFKRQRLDPIGSLSGETLFAVTGLPDMELISVESSDYRWDPIATLDKKMSVLQDSLHLLKSPNPIFGDPAEFSSGIRMNGLVYLGTPPYRYQDRFILMEDERYLIARARSDSATFLIYDSDHTLNNSFSLNVKAREVKVSDLEYAFRNHPMANNDRARRVLEEHVHEIKPPFLNIWGSENYIWLHTDTSDERKQIVVLSLDGDPAGKFYLSEYDNIQSIKENRLYTIYQNPETGHSIRVYQVRL